MQKLLDNDSFLQEAVENAIRDCQQGLHRITVGIDLLFHLQSRLSKGSAIWSDIYIFAMSGGLVDSELLKSCLSSLTKVQSHVMQEILDVLIAECKVPGEIQLCQSNLSRLVKDITATHPGGLRSGHDIQHSNLRTTVVAHKVELSEHAATLTPQESAYTQIVDQVDEALRSFFAEYLTNPKDLFLHEIFIYDLPSPHRDAFNPRPRFAIERALGSPFDYLGHESDDGTRGQMLSASQPATAILYQLYIESGSLLNTADLWSAFWTIVGDEDAEDEESEQQKVLALFSRGLAELKYLGMVKHSRKRMDHLSKLSWKGL